MKLTKKHIGGFFTVGAADGSWAYLLLDIKKNNALFICFPSGKYEIEKGIKDDWVPYKLGVWLPVESPFGGGSLKTKESIKEGWKIGRVSE